MSKYLLSLLLLSGVAKSAAMDDSEGPRGRAIFTVKVAPGVVLSPPQGLMAQIPGEKSAFTRIKKPVRLIERSLTNANCGCTATLIDSNRLALREHTSGMRAESTGFGDIKSFWFSESGDLFLVWAKQGVQVYDTSSIKMVAKFKCTNITEIELNEITNTLKVRYGNGSTTVRLD